MSLEFNGNRIGAIQYNGVTIGEAMIDGQIVYRSGHPLVRSRPDYWYSMENGAHDYNRGSLYEPLQFENGQFANRGDHAYAGSARGYINGVDSWNDGFTVAAWLEIMAQDSTAYFFARGSNVENDEYIYCIATSSTHGIAQNSISIRIGVNGVASTWAYGDPNIIPQSGWFHLAVTYVNAPGSPNLAKIFVNGELVSTISFSEMGPLTFSPDAQLSFTDDTTGTNRRLFANIDDLAIWSRELRESEVRSIHRAGPVPTEDLFEPYTSSGVNSTLGSGIKHTWTVPHDDMWFLQTYAWAGSTVTANISIRDDSGNTLMSKAHDSGSSDEFRISAGDAVYLTEGTVVTWHSNISGSSPRDLHWHINQSPVPPEVQFIRHPVNFTNAMPSSGAWTEINSIRVVGSGMSNIYSTFRFDGLFGIGSQNRGVRILLNGSVLDSNTSTGTNVWSSSLDILGVQVSHGDVITMQGKSDANHTRRRNITRNALAIMPD